MPQPESRLKAFARHFFPYAIPALLLSALSLTPTDEFAIALAGVSVATMQWIWRPLTVAVVVVPLFAAISIGNAIKVRYTGEALIWQDFLYAIPNLGENVGTLIQYLNVTVVLLGLALLVFVPLAIRLDRRHLQHSYAGRAAFSAILMLFYVPTASSGIEDARRELQSDRAVGAWALSGHHGNSALGRFIQSTKIEKAELTSAAVTAEKFEAQARNHFTDADKPALVPDVIAVLQESQFDPRQLNACATRPDCQMEMFEPGPYSRQSGPLHVHIIGGGTWKSEFALMTGVPHTWFSAGDYAPYTVAPRIRNSIGHHMKSLGYRTAVVYPVQKGMMNAFQAYRAYGMDEFYGLEALNLPMNWCAVTDHVMYEKLAEIRERLAADDDRPLFLVMLTINNHGPHGKRCAGPATTKTTNSDPTDELANKLDDFLERSKAADRASKAFREKALGGDRPTVLLVAGDHQPGFEGLAADLPRTPHRAMPPRETLYFTNYQFFSNVGEIRPEIDRELDIMFLPSTLLEIAKLPLGPLFSANRALREICNGRLDLCPSGDFLDSYRHHLALSGFVE